jgi:hypothetical protein
MYKRLGLGDDALISLAQGKNDDQQQAGAAAAPQRNPANSKAAMAASIPLEAQGTRKKERKRKKKERGTK